MISSEKSSESASRIKREMRAKVDLQRRRIVMVFAEIIPGCWWTVMKFISLFPIVYNENSGLEKKCRHSS